MWVLRTAKIRLGLSVRLRRLLLIRTLLIILLSAILTGNLISLIKVSKVITDCRNPEQFNHHILIRYNGSSQVSHTKDLIVRSAYFDDRPRNGHKNATVFMLQVRKDILEQSATLIQGCGVGEQIATAGHFNIRPCGNSILNDWIHRNYKHITHDEVVLDCFDLWAENGSNAFVIYKPDVNSSSARIVKSEYPFLIPVEHQHHHDLSQKYNFTVMSCMNIFGTPSWFVEWLQYQRAIGIDHVHVTIQDSFLQLQGREQSYLKQAVREGFVTVDVWQPWLNSTEIYYHSQTLAYTDCIYRYRGTYDYAFMLDSDDFFVPMNPGEKKLHYYVDKWCKESASCAFSWIEYYPDLGLKGEPGIDGNVTNVLNSSAHTICHVGKSLHKLSVVMDTAIHQAEGAVLKTKTFSVKYHHGIVKIPDDEAYIAHIRKNRKPGYLC